MASEKLCGVPGPENSFFPVNHGAADSRGGVRRLPCPPEPNQSHSEGPHGTQALSIRRMDTLACFTDFPFSLFLRACGWKTMNKGNRELAPASSQPGRSRGCPGLETLGRASPVKSCDISQSGKQGGDRLWGHPVQKRGFCAVPQQA